MFIEKQRSELEELDVIESAIADRYKRDSSLPVPSGAKPGTLKTKKRSHRETMLLQHEIKLFKNKYNELCESIKFNSNSSLFSKEMAAIHDPEGNLQEFQKQLNNIKSHYNLYGETDPIESIKNNYKLFSSASEADRKGKKAKRKCILSIASVGAINETQLFSPEESYGRFLDLHDSYSEYININNSNINTNNNNNNNHNTNNNNNNHDDDTKDESKKEMTYIQYLESFDHFNYNITTDYLQKLHDYLVKFFTNSNPLENVAELEKQIPKPDDKTIDENGKIFCAACKKWFAKESVYNGHLTGKKHLKNVKDLKSDQNDKDLITAIKFWASKLADVRKATIANYERRKAFSEREKLLEDEEFEAEQNEFTDVSSNDENSDGENSKNDDSDDDMFRHLPLDADGQPIPFWLYKLQGYNKVYSCEICGNSVYKGRIVFNKHFILPKHQQGLKFLGITDKHLPLFKNIVSINEAKELWMNIKRENRIKEGEIENAVELEDAEGNVMSTKDYLELKRQGLL